MARHGTDSQAVTTAATAHVRGGRHACCCAREPKANEITELERLTLETRAIPNTISPISRPHSIPSGTSCEQFAKQGTRPRPIHYPQEKETEVVRRDNRTSDHRHDHSIEVARGFDRFPRPNGSAR